MPLGKMDIVALLAQQKPGARYLELCTPTTGNDFNSLERRNLSVVHRMMYRCHPDYSDGGKIDFRTKGLDIKPCIDQFRGGGHRYDIILVDSWHGYHTSARDLRVAYGLLKPGGFMVVHDCFPVTLEQTTPMFIRGAWCGQTYRAYLNFVCARPGLTYCTVDTDFGCGVIRKPAHRLSVQSTPLSSADSNLKAGLPSPHADCWAQWAALQGRSGGAFRLFMKYKPELSNLVTAADFPRWLSGQVAPLADKKR